MDIKKLKIKNFKGITEKTIDMSKDKIFCLCGKNGQGKTSTLEALNFILCGRSDGNYIRNNQGACEVSIDLSDDEIITRRYFCDGGIEHFINGKKPKKVSDIDIILNGTADKKMQNALNIVSSSALDSMNAQDMATFFIGFLEEKPKWDMVLNSLEEPSEFSVQIAKEEINALYGETSSECTLSDIQKLYDVLYSRRTKVNKQAKVTIVDVEKPKMTADEISKQLYDIAGKEQMIATYQKLKQSYDVALKNKAVYDKQVAELKEATKEERKDMTETKKQLDDKLNIIQNAIQGNSSLLAALQNSAATLKKTIENLQGNTCPFSKQVVCSTDKSSIIADLNTELKKTEADIQKGMEALQKQKEQEKKVKDNIAKCMEYMMQYNTYLMNKKELKRLLDNPPIVPECPKEVQVINYTEEKARLKKAQADIVAYENMQKQKAVLEEVKKEQAALQYLVTSLKANGPVFKKIILYYTDIFNDAANQTAKEMNLNYRVKFVSSDGLHVYFKTSIDRKFMPYNLLSKGERIIAQAILLDVINQLTGSNIFVLDDIDVLDDSNFQLLMNYLVNVASEKYDAVFLTMTDTRERQLPKGVQIVKY